MINQNFKTICSRRNVLLVGYDAVKDHRLFAYQSPFCCLLAQFECTGWLERIEHGLIRTSTSTSTSISTSAGNHHRHTYVRRVCVIFIPTSQALWTVEVGVEVEVEGEIVSHRVMVRRAGDSNFSLLFLSLPLHSSVSYRPTDQQTNILIKVLVTRGLKPVAGAAETSPNVLFGSVT